MINTVKIGVGLPLVATWDEPVFINVLMDETHEPLLDEDGEDLLDEL